MSAECWPTEKNGDTRPTIGVAYANPTIVAAIAATPRTIRVFTFIESPFDFGINGFHCAFGTGAATFFKPIENWKSGLLYVQRFVHETPCANSFEPFVPADGSLEALTIWLLHRTLVTHKE